MKWRSKSIMDLNNDETETHISGVNNRNANFHKEGGKNSAENVDLINNNNNKFEINDNLFKSTQNLVDRLQLSTEEITIQPVHPSIIGGEDTWFAITYVLSNTTRYFSCASTRERNQWICSLKKTLMLNDPTRRRTENSIKLGVFEIKGLGGGLVNGSSVASSSIKSSSSTSTSKKKNKFVPTSSSNGVSSRKKLLSSSSSSGGKEYMYYGEIYIDDKLYGRTASKRVGGGSCDDVGEGCQDSCFWGEFFQFRDLPSSKSMSEVVLMIFKEKLVLTPSTTKMTGNSNGTNSSSSHKNSKNKINKDKQMKNQYYVNHQSGGGLADYNIFNNSQNNNNCTSYDLNTPLSNELPTSSPPPYVDLTHDSRKRKATAAAAVTGNLHASNGYAANNFYPFFTPSSSGGGGGGRLKRKGDNNSNENRKLVGKIHIPIVHNSVHSNSSTPSCSSATTEKWYSLESGSNRKDRDSHSVRLQYQYSSVEVLPLKCYADLYTFLREEYKFVCRVFESHVSVKVKEELAHSLVAIFHIEDMAEHVLADMVIHEISAVQEESLTFRANTITTKAMETYIKIVGGRYLQVTLQQFIQEVVGGVSVCDGKEEADLIDLEVDPVKVEAQMRREWERRTNHSKGGLVKKNTLKKQRGGRGDEVGGGILCSKSPIAIDDMMNRLINHQIELKSRVMQIWSRITASPTHFPPTLSRCFQKIRHHLKVMGRPDEMSDNLISSCIFLRYLCPAILSPSLFRLTSVYPSDRANRNLTLIAKALQTLANFSKYEGGRDNSMEFLNSFLEEKSDEMRLFLQQISSPAIQGLNKPSSSSTSAGGCSSYLVCEKMSKMDLSFHLSQLHSTLSQHLCKALTSFADKIVVEEEKDQIASSPSSDSSSSSPPSSQNASSSNSFITKSQILRDILSNINSDLHSPPSSDLLSIRRQGGGVEIVSADLHLRGHASKRVQHVSASTTVTPSHHHTPSGGNSGSNTFSNRFSALSSWSWTLPKKSSSTASPSSNNKHKQVRTTANMASVIDGGNHPSAPLVAPSSTSSNPSSRRLFSSSTGRRDNEMISLESAVGVEVPSGGWAPAATPRSVGGPSSSHHSSSSYSTSPVQKLFSRGGGHINRLYDVQQLDTPAYRGNGHQNLPNQANLPTNNPTAGSAVGVGRHNRRNLLEKRRRKMRRRHHLYGSHVSLDAATTSHHHSHCNGGLLGGVNGYHDGEGVYGVGGGLISNSSTSLDSDVDSTYSSQCHSSSDATANNNNHHRPIIHYIPPSLTTIPRNNLLPHPKLDANEIGDDPPFGPQNAVCRGGEIDGEAFSRDLNQTSSPSTQVRSLMEYENEIKSLRCAMDLLQIKLMKAEHKLQCEQHQMTLKRGNANDNVCLDEKKTEQEAAVDINTDPLEPPIESQNKVDVNTSSDLAERIEDANTKLIDEIGKLQDKYKIEGAHGEPHDEQLLSELVNCSSVSAECNSSNNTLRGVGFESMRFLDSLHSTTI